MILTLDPAVGHVPDATVYVPEEPVRFDRDGADGITQAYRLDRVVTHANRPWTAHLVKVNRAGRDFARGGHRVLTRADLEQTHPDLVAAIDAALANATPRPVRAPAATLREDLRRTPAWHAAQPRPATAGPPLSDLPVPVEHLLAVVTAHAPEGPARAEVRRVVRVLNDEGASLRELELMLAGVLVDGLRHGNWPWS